MICYHNMKLMQRTSEQVSRQLAHSLAISSKPISHQEGGNEHASEEHGPWRQVDLDSNPSSVLLHVILELHCLIQKVGALTSTLPRVVVKAKENM